MKLKYQLLITLLVASALLIAIMLAVSSWSFNRGFIGYVNNSEKARLATMVSDLSAAYSEERSWDWTRKGSKTWKNLIVRNKVERRQGQPRRDPPPRPDPPPKPDPSGPKNKRSPGAGEPDSGRPNRQRPRPPPKLNSWLVLADKNKLVLFGKINSRDDIEWLPIESDAQTVGFLGYKKVRQLNRQIDRVFAQQQKRSFAYAALGMALLSALLSIPLSARIVRPLLTANNAVSEINHGNYSHRVRTNRKDEFGDLATNINSLGLTLEQNLAARQRWIAEISHELRTPLAVLQSEIEAMQDGIRKTDKNAMQSLHTEVLQLGRLVNDLHQLSLSDIGALEYQMHTLPLDKIVDNYLSSNQPLLEEAGLRLDFSAEHATVFADEQRINQLLDNLLQNSVRYTTTDGTIKVAVVVDQDKVILSWADTAPGVANDDLDLLFDPLYRTEESRNRQHAGSGLGLAIVKKIVTAHEGQITAAHAALGGLEIRITLPASTGVKS